MPESSNNKATTFHPVKRRGMAFKDGKFYLFGETHVIVFRGGDAPACWVKKGGVSPKANQGWFSSHTIADDMLPLVTMTFPDPDDKPVDINADGLIKMSSGQLLLPFMKKWEGDRLAKSRFLATFPPGILERIWRLKDGQFRLLNLMARCGKPAMELFDSNPCLAWALAHADRFKMVERPLRSARALLQKPQREILKWLGFPPTASVRKIFRKIDIRNISDYSLFFLRDKLSGRDVDNRRFLSFIRHLSRINGPALEALRRHEDLLTFPLLQAIAEDASTQDMTIGNILDDTVTMAKDLDIPLRAPFKNAEDLRRKHDEWMVLDAKAESLPEFPPAPFFPMEDSGIVPICSGEGLVNEGKEQSNCCFSYGRKVVQGRYFIYRVERPFRGTLGIRRGKDNEWYPDQVRLRCNGSVPEPLALELFSTVLARPVAARELKMAEEPPDFAPQAEPIPF